jgi:hypothetical protein
MLCPKSAPPDIVAELAPPSATHLLSSDLHLKISSDRRSNVGITRDLRPPVLPASQADAASRLDDALPDLPWKSGVQTPLDRKTAANSRIEKAGQDNFACNFIKLRWQERRDLPKPAISKHCEVGGGMKHPQWPKLPGKYSHTASSFRYREAQNASVPALCPVAKRNCRAAILLGEFCIRKLARRRQNAAKRLMVTL